MQLPAVAGEPQVQLLPDPGIGPVVHVVVGIDLDVEAADARRAHAVQSEPALVAGTDQLIARRGRVSQDPQPGERIHPLPLAQQDDGLVGRQMP